MDLNALNRFIFQSKLRVKYAIKGRVLANPYLSKMFKEWKFKKAASKRYALQEIGFNMSQEVLDILRNIAQSGLMFGSLLGVVRDRRFIEYDDDIDFGIVVEDSAIWETIVLELSKAGYYPIRSFEYKGRITEFAFSNGELDFDVFGLFPTVKDNVYRVFFYKFLDGTLYKNPTQRTVKYSDIEIEGFTRTLRFDDCVLAIPNNAESVLEKVYGPNWMAPDPNWITGSNFETVTNEYGIMIKY